MLTNDNHNESKHITYIYTLLFAQIAAKQVNYTSINSSNQGKKKRLSKKEEYVKMNELYLKAQQNKLIQFTTKVSIAKSVFLVYLLVFFLFSSFFCFAAGFSSSFIVMCCSSFH